MTVALTLGIIALVFAFATSVAVTVLVSRALSASFRTVESMHERSNRQLSDVLDRLMTVKWEDLAALRSLEEPEEGGFFAPGELSEETGVQVEQRTLWGTMRTLDDEAQRADDNMNQLLDEDFPREGSVA